MADIGHAKLAPSAASRWTVCPGSVPLTARVVGSSSQAADEGTACHKVLELCLENGTPAKGWAGKTLNVGGEGSDQKARPIVITAEMTGWVQEVIDWVMAYCHEREGTLLRTEERVHPGRELNAMDNLWGTVDILLENPNELVVVDAKFGYVHVEVEGNLQLMLYGLGAISEYGWVHEQVRLVIAQPRAGGMRDVVYSASELESFRKRMLPKVKEALSGTGPLRPTEDGCRWCSAAALCPALQEQSIMMAKREFSVVETISKQNFTLILENADRIRKAVDAVEEHATKLLQLGQPIPGFKLVHGNKRRAWKDEAKAEALLSVQMKLKKKDLYKTTFITPAAAEKLVGKADGAKLAPLIETPKGEPTLAREDDPREPLLPEFKPVN